ncbi:1-(5-phosphoribosyl)-5-[(5-phosphoribosylamino)methylideneamino]imidazole-4-carboxamide isomerase [Oceanobacillus halotolerans]|uniref:1-(5-phosphoribosyl)-5-[(5- phosphoribosylamino)methylideneamino]imidazole-4- carboxamide isomerase n=1 Tax=Oceanobacillus halotolerans TaxID=2663380 RepID=UPI0013DC2660|nr:1-(5-phosphoribosyl)-5-[(5-phosphoribosylamino)methylideneamino]imidazole-4-carboxamide isomerase [Oceanobacillus halotolerans]
MILFPAIDIRNGKCVRLVQGDYNQEKVYGDNPEEIAQQWANKGAEYLHIVDLDGAKTGESVNQPTIKAIAQNTSIPIQVGGGIRSLNIIKDYLAAGVSRVIIGTAAIRDKTFLQEAVSQFGDQVAVSIDARNGYVATDGWLHTSSVKATDLIKELEEIGVKTIVYTDIFKDGMLKGPNFTELQTINEATTIQVIASGGVTTEDDVKKLQSLNLYGAIIGKALYDGTLSLEALLDGDTNVG